MARGVTYVSAHFTIGEFACQAANRTPYPHEWRETRLVKLCTTLETIRAELNARQGRPVKLVITSGYRTPAHNASLSPPGAKASQHLEGQAADIIAYRLLPDGSARSPRDWRKLHALTVGRVVADLMRTQRILPGGVGHYKSFTHVDVRGWRTTFGSHRP